MDAERVYVAIQGGGLRAFERETGTPVWSRDIGTALPPVVSGELLFVAGRDSILALDVATGEQVWTRSLDGEVAAPLLSHGSTLIALTRGEVMGIQQADGVISWRRGLEAPTKFRAAALDGSKRDGVVLTLDNGQVIALDLKTGEPMWKRSLPGTLSAPGTARDRVLVGSTNNFFYALDAESGRERWRWRTGGDVIGAAAAGDRVYFASLDNILRAVNRDNGNQQWKAEMPTRPAAPPIPVGDVVLIAGVNRVDGFVGKTGASLGSYEPNEDLRGVPAIDADLQPFRVALVVFEFDGKITALRPVRMLFPDPPLTPFQKLPGRELQPERRPTS